MDTFWIILLCKELFCMCEFSYNWLLYTLILVQMIWSAYSGEIVGALKYLQMRTKRKNTPEVFVEVPQERIEILVLGFKPWNKDQQHIIAPESEKRESMVREKKKGIKDQFLESATIKDDKSQSRIDKLGAHENRRFQVVREKSYLQTNPQETLSQEFQRTIHACQDSVELHATSPNSLLLFQFFTHLFLWLLGRYLLMNNQRGRTCAEGIPYISDLIAIHSFQI